MLRVGVLLLRTAAVGGLCLSAQERGEAACCRCRALSGTFETSPRSTTAGTIVFLPVKEPGYARAIERLAARRPRAQTQPDQTGGTLVSARSDQPGDGYRFILCHRRRPIRGGRHFPDRGLPC